MSGSIKYYFSSNPLNDYLFGDLWNIRISEKPLRHLFLRYLIIFPLRPPLHPGRSPVFFPEQFFYVFSLQKAIL